MLGEVPHAPAMNADTEAGPDAMPETPDEKKGGFLSKFTESLKK